MNLEAIEKKYGKTVKIGRERFRRFIPYPGPVEDGTCRCIGCGQIDEEPWHDMDVCREVREAIEGQHKAAFSERCTKIADRAVPQYRGGARSYSCGGTMAKRWQAAWDAACIALGGDPAKFVAGIGMTRFDLPAYALSVRQPWAWAIVHAGKPVENRVKRAITLGGMDKHRFLAIHAASGMTRDEYESARDFMATLGVPCPRPDDLVRGAVIGSVQVDGITKDSDSPWFFGPWALLLSSAKPHDPVPCSGQLGAFLWGQRRVDAVREPLPWMQAWPANGTRKKPDLGDWDGFDFSELPK